ncbi:MAG TPA: dihydroorotate dehydrogenase [Gemmatimonadaceae bacterium]|nr:dihydroorotate dehydrogenase [Gemmatimonadaceae bacterium]
MTHSASLLAVTAASLDFQNPVILAAGTAAYGRELASVMNLEALGGIVTKAVSPEPRKGAPAPRVAEFDGGMMNAVGLANPGLEAVIRDDLPWLAQNVRKARVIVNVVGSTVDDFETVTRSLADIAVVDAFELNVSCPNTRAGGAEFGADRNTLTSLVSKCRAATKKPLFVKLSPMLVDIADTAGAAVDAGADGLTLVNTIPGLAIDVESKRPALGFGSGGISGVGLLPIGVLAVWKVSRAVKVPLIGVGGITKGTDVVQYLLAGASLVGLGTAALRDPKAPERIIRELTSWCTSHNVSTVTDLTGKLEWPS